MICSGNVPYLRQGMVHYFGTRKPLYLLAFPSLGPMYHTNSLVRVIENEGRAASVFPPRLKWKMPWYIGTSSPNVSRMPENTGASASHTRVPSLARSSGAIIGVWQGSARDRNRPKSRRLRHRGMIDPSQSRRRTLMLTFSCWRRSNRHEQRAKRGKQAQTRPERGFRA